MSQFEQKYYKHYHVKSGDKNGREYPSSGFDFFAWSRRYRFFEIVTVLLLLLILLCLCFRCGGAALGGAAAFSLPSFSPSISMPAVGGGAVAATEDEEIVAQTVSSSAETVPDSAVIKKDELGMKYNVKILPEAAQLVPSGHTKVTMQEYMYYVHETSQGYPDFVDPATSRVIKAKQPECYTPSCPATGITQRDKENYAQWLGKLTHNRYTIVNEDNGFKLKSR